MHNHIREIKLTLSVLINGRISYLKRALNPIIKEIKAKINEATPYHTFKNLWAV
jgi:hypothetical protein